jgi:hypothetical protein
VRTEEITFKLDKVIKQNKEKMVTEERETDN